MTSTAVIDANVILRYLLGDHPAHFPESRDFFERVREGRQQAFLSEGVLVECVYVLLKVYRVPRQQVADSLGDLLNYRGIMADDVGMLGESLRVFSASNVDIVDAIVHVTARHRGWTVFSFDNDLGKLDR